MKRYEILGLYIRHRSTPKSLNIVDTFLRPMAIIRGVNEVTIQTVSSESLVEVIKKTMESPITWSWLQILGISTSFEQRGSQAFKNKDYVTSICYYNRGALATMDLYDMASYLSLDYADPLFDEYFSLASDFHSHSALAVNQLVDSRMEPSQGNHMDVLLAQLNVAISETSLAFWSAMSDKQRSKAHYRRGIAHENRAAYETLHGPTPRHDWPTLPSCDDFTLKLFGMEDLFNNELTGDSTTFLKPDCDPAARDLDLALQLGGIDETIKRAPERVDARLGHVKSEKDAPLVEIELSSGRIWEGDARLAKRWGLCHGVAACGPPSSDPNELEDYEDHIMLE
jgi:hypothetical protein